MGQERIGINRINRPAETVKRSIDFSAIRTKETDYHTRFYEETPLFQPGTWLARPVHAVLELLERLPLQGSPLQGPIVLDLGCGPGRNAIPVARRLKDSGGKVHGVDLLPVAIRQLLENADRYDVSGVVSGTVADAESYTIRPEAYNYIIACSCLEHLSSEQAFRRKLEEMRAGTQAGGINIIMMSTDVTERDTETGATRRGDVELNLSCEQAFSILNEIYAAWEKLIERHSSQQILENQNGTTVQFISNWITFAVQNNK